MFWEAKTVFLPVNSVQTATSRWRRIMTATVRRILQCSETEIGTFKIPPPVLQLCSSALELIFRLPPTTTATAKPTSLFSEMVSGIY